jgi:hypothetical protein
LFLNFQTETGTVYSVFVDPQNRLWVGGEFTIPGTDIQNLAYWDNTGSWKSLKSGDTNIFPDGAVYALYLYSDDDKVYIGGNFSNIGATPTGSLARINNLTLETVGNVTGKVYCFGTKYDTGGNIALMVGGDFTLIDGTSYLSTATYRPGVGFARLKDVEGVVYALKGHINQSILIAGDFDIVDGESGYGNAISYSTLWGWEKIGQFDNVVKDVYLNESFNGIAYCVGDFTTFTDRDGTVYSDCNGFARIRKDFTDPILAVSDNHSLYLEAGSSKVISCLHRFDVTSKLFFVNNKTNILYITEAIDPTYVIYGVKTVITVENIKKINDIQVYGLNTLTGLYDVKTDVKILKVKENIKDYEVIFMSAPIYTFYKVVVTGEPIRQ